MQSKAAYPYTDGKYALPAAPRYTSQCKALQYPGYAKSAVPLLFLQVLFGQTSRFPPCGLSQSAPLYENAVKPLFFPPGSAADHLRDGKKLFIRPVLLQ